MDNLDKYLDDLLLFMANEIEDKSFQREHATFNFQLSSSNEDGDDLKEFKNIVNINNNDIIEQILMKAINENYINTRPYCQKFSGIYLEDTGFKRAKAIKFNRKNSKKKILTNSLDKFIAPIVIPIISAVIVAYLTSNIQNNQLSNEIEKLKRDIEWIKQKK
ncbi:MAG: hypothetical protein DRG78_17150 [Epsilonproteobacteria bacterium]|nr:MAG: hypothetical protein DRG78_17150 [Campylobacterota bacterium]